MKKNFLKKEKCKKEEEEYPPCVSECLYLQCLCFCFPLNVLSLLCFFLGGGGFKKRESGVLKLCSPERDQGPGPTVFHVAAWLQIVRELTAPTTSLFTL